MYLKIQINCFEDGRFFVTFLKGNEFDYFIWVRDGEKLPDWFAEIYVPNPNEREPSGIMRRIFVDDGSVFAQFEPFTIHSIQSYSIHEPFVTYEWNRRKRCWE